MHRVELPRLPAVAAMLLMLIGGACEEYVETSLSTQALTAGALGTTCAGDLDCGTGLACFAEAGSKCLCRAGLSACGTGCVSLASDPNNCGSCGRQCASGVSCAAGLCLGDEPTASHLAPIIDPAVQVSGGTPGSNCDNASEAYGEIPATNGDAKLVSAYQRLASPGTSFKPHTNWATAWNTWSSAVNATPTASDCCPGAPTCTCNGIGDPWATTSGLTGLEYVSHLLLTNTGIRCFGIGATEPSNIDNNIWSFPPACIETYGFADGPSIHYDLGGQTLWGVDRGNTSTLTDVVTLYAFSPCQYGRPGESQCPLSAGPVLVASASKDHPVVVTNPCTHNAIVAYRGSGGDLDDDIILKFYNSAGVQQGMPFTVEDGASWAPTSACANSGCNDPAKKVPKCTSLCGTDCGAADCMSVASKVQVATKVDGATCYAYVSYDKRLLVSTDGQYHMKGVLKIVNVTNQSSPSVAATWFSSALTAVTNEFESTAAANGFNKNVGFFFYRQRAGNPCDTVMWGRTDTNLGLVSLPYLTTAISGPFKSMKFPLLLGMGHYTGIFKRGLQGGYLFPLWTEPISSTGSGNYCVTCQGTNYNLRVMGTRILP